ncbi:MAG: hypothetical protein Q7S74_03295 [Nanoarchaeota archaeon]|nr:hypothetical protein [Nanoarchaeota archaeon]
MLPKRAYLVLGISFLLIGFILILNSFSGITGKVILEDASPKISFYWALWFIIGGILILESAVAEVEREKESPLIYKIGKVVPAAKQSSCLILLDSDFVKNIQKKFDEGGKMAMPHSFFGEYEHQMPMQVMHELSSRSNPKRAPLVSNKTLNYLTNVQNTSVNNYKPSLEESAQVLALWKRYTGSGKHTGREQEEKFKRSGDMSLLCQAINRGKKYTIILSDNYHEIGVIAEKLKYEGINVHVMGKNQLFGKK